MDTQNNWLKENIAPLIALIYTCFSLVIYTLVLTHIIAATENIAFLIINSVTNIMMIIVGYFFGSSIGSKTKQEALEKISDSTTTVSASVKKDSAEGINK